MEDLDTPVTEIKLTNRRRMAWMSAIQTATFVFGFAALAMFSPGVASAVAALVPVIPMLLVFLSWPQLAYFGATILIDRILGRRSESAE